MTVHYDTVDITSHWNALKITEDYVNFTLHRTVHHVLGDRTLRLKRRYTMLDKTCENTSRTINSKHGIKGRVPDHRLVVSLRTPIGSPTSDDLW